jgi:hypothetical protein
MFLSISIHPSHSQSILIRDFSLVNERIRKNESASVLIRLWSRLGGPFVQLDPDGFVPVISQQWSFRSLNLSRLPVRHLSLTYLVHQHVLSCSHTGPMHHLAWGGPEGSRKPRFPDFLPPAQDGGKIVSLTHRPQLPPGNTPGRGWVDPRAIVRSEGFMSMKYSIQSATFWFVAQYLNHCATAVPAPPGISV